MTVQIDLFVISYLVCTYIFTKSEFAIVVFPLIVTLIVLSEEVIGCVCARIFASNRACFFARVSNRLSNL